jgi:hypothetical protein
MTALSQLKIASEHNTRITSQLLRQSLSYPSGKGWGYLSRYYINIRNHFGVLGELLWLEQYENRTFCGAWLPWLRSASGFYRMRWPLGTYLLFFSLPLKLICDNLEGYRDCIYSYDYSLDSFTAAREKDSKTTQTGWLAVSGMRGLVICAAITSTSLLGTNKYKRVFYSTSR